MSCYNMVNIEITFPYKYQHHILDFDITQFLVLLKLPIQIIAQQVSCMVSKDPIIEKQIKLSSYLIVKATIHYSHCHLSPYSALWKKYWKTAKMWWLS